jgi:hypothetical protein
MNPLNEFVATHVGSDGFPVTQGPPKFVEFAAE